jgi:hypothetical protein
MAAIVVMAAACGGSGGDTSPDATAGAAESATTAPTTTELPATEITEPSEPATSEAATTVPATTESVEPVDEEWMAVAADGCMCADGGPFELWERPADPTKVVLYFEGGGACFSAESCSFTDGTYVPNIDLGVSPDGRGGIFDQTNPENPLADHSFVYVPYCTGDVFLGDNTQAYSDTLTVEHNGFPNATKGLDTVLANYPDVEQLVVTGASAGSIPTPAFAGLASDELPDAEIITFGDSSAAYPDVGPINAVIGDLWGTTKNIPDWPVNEGITVEEWSLPGLYVQAGKHAPSITFARFDYAYDTVQSTFAALAGIPADDLLAFIDQTESDIEAEGVLIASYIAPGTDHTIIAGDGFYEMEVEGVRLVDFLTTLVAGGVPDDVSCVECGRP